MTKLINDELEFHSNDSDEEVSEEEWIKTKYYDSAFFNGTILMIANQMAANQKKFKII